MSVFAIIGIIVVVLFIIGIVFYIGAAILGIILLIAMVIGLIALFASCGGGSAALALALA